ncbi:Solute carrier family 35 member G1 [Holothuria leucospilota]|uniref:Solute carrier family 35 member G1 n=1 Tax=Holothuria leucospilota TaxID=206669 RepID=A0A9Q1BNS5_HOLLE|nr:Solute carrier family 35 member G1 [Holothuria leucospilota]
MACVFFASTGVFVQLASSVHVLLSSCFRGVILVIFPLIGLIFSQNKPTFSKRDILWLIVNSFLLTNTQVCGFMGYRYIPVGDVNAILFSTPLLSGILAWIILKERLTLFDVALTIVSVVGVILVSKPAFVFGAEDDGSSSDRLLGSLYAICALGSASCVFVVTRKLRPFPANALVLTLGFGIVVCPTSAVLNTYIGEWDLPANLVQAIYLSAVGVSGFLAILFLCLALETEKAIHISVTNTLTIILTYIMQFFIFHIYPDVISGVGAILICGSMCGVFISNWITSSANEVDSSVGGHYHNIVQREGDPIRESLPQQNTQTTV